MVAIHVCVFSVIRELNTRFQLIKVRLKLVDNIYSQPLLQHHADKAEGSSPSLLPCPYDVAEGVGSRYVIY